MVLASGYGQRQLHQWSRQAVQHQKITGTTKSLQNVPTNTHISARGTAATLKDNPKIPNPSLFEFESKMPENDNTGLPTVGECAAHLELLQAFYHIYVRVSSSTALDDVLGIKPEPRIVYRKKYLGYRRGYSRKAVNLKDVTFKERRKTKWPFYLALAATRFLAWAEAVENVMDGSVASQVTLLHLPPLDVLMVWHALLLNPSWFRSFEGRQPKRLYDTPFPWKAIHKAIDADKRHSLYNLPAKSVVWFAANTGLAPDLFEALVEADKSIRVRQLLKMHGSPSRFNNTHRGMPVEDIDVMLKGPHNLNELEINFLECCRTAIGTNTTINKLVEAVQRQASFVNKMEKQLWIRSPAVEGTLHRAIDRYSKFLKLFKLYPKMMLVPTLDIDLVWHTHQCSPSRYDVGMLKMAGRLINHDDKIGEVILNPGFTRTKNLFRIRFAQEYQVCHCWDCEALLSAVSSHNSETRPDNEAIARHVLDEVAYYRAVELAK
ncbi:hypothetical protein V502_05570 [Pseudogymnoascus sp. VKM F-4520 (FW-2644)]|nr:hypothetical protein V502_05570 [Pseudogymnoascus sp. VKM F-4520 (FW-2644)]